MYASGKAPTLAAMARGSAVGPGSDTISESLCRVTLDLHFPQERGNSDLACHITRAA